MIARGTLEAALTEMNAQKMTHLIKFITKYIQSPNMSLSLIHLCRKLLDFCTLNSMETNGEYWKLLESFGELHNILLNEIRLQDEFLIMKGIMLNAGM